MLLLINVRELIKLQKIQDVLNIEYIPVTAIDSLTLVQTLNKKSNSQRPHKLCF